MNLQITEGPPSKVNRMLQKNELDISPSSSVVYLSAMEEFGFLSGHSISSIGPIKSIILISKYPLKQLSTTIALSPVSETSNLLLRVILEKFYNLHPRYISVQKQDLSSLSYADAVLFIGDDALEICYRHISGLYQYDLGEVWFSETGLPAVFALWIYQKRNFDKIKIFQDELDRAKNWALDNLRYIAQFAPLRNLFGEDMLVQYWKSISYDFKEPHLKGLELFGRYISELQRIS